MRFVEVDQPISLHPAKFSRQSTAVHGQKVSELLSGKWYIKFVAAMSVHLRSQVGEQLIPGCFLAHVL